MEGTKSRISETEKQLRENLLEAYEYFEKSGKIIITTHVNPDGDAIGSALALYYYAVKRNKEARLLIPNGLPFNLKFMNGIENVETYVPEKHDKAIEAADTIFILDLNHSSRLSTLEPAILGAKADKIIIDHHLEPGDFARHYVVDTEASSTGELIWRFLKLDNEHKIDKNIADALYVALITDTGSFRFPRTDGDVHRMAAELLDAGADPVDIYEEIYNKNPLTAVHLLGHAFAGIELYYDGRLCIMTLRDEHFKLTGGSEDDVEGFVEKTMSIKGVEIGILMIEAVERNEVRVSFRSKGENDIRQMAIMFGGGGHYHAAGARIKNMPFDDVRNELIKTAGRYFTSGG